MRENLPAQRLVSLWAPSHALCSVSYLHTAHNTLLYASLTSLSSSSSFTFNSSEGHLFLPVSSSTPLLHLVLLSFLVATPGSSHDWSRTCFPISRASPRLGSGPEGRCFPRSSPLFLFLSSFPIHLFLPFSSFLRSSFLRSPVLLL